MKKVPLLLVAAAIICLACFALTSSPKDVRKSPTVKGLTLVAPPSPFVGNPMDAVNQVGANWIAVVPYAYTPQDQPAVYFNSNRQWWGERPEGASKTIELAKKAGLKVMLKPQVWSSGWWTGDYQFEREADWSKWEAAYRDYIVYFAKLADSLQVDMFCIGTEFKTSVRDRPQFWKDLVVEIRDHYRGKLTYAANWDNFQNIPFWSALDVIGINAYFPLCEETTPSVKRLCKAWQTELGQIRSFQSRHDKPIVFTEYGYLTVDGCADKTWLLEKKIQELSINQQAQANAIDALHLTFSQEPYWQGGFLWKWFPEMKGHEGYPEKDYTPQGKLAEEILMEWFESESADP